MKARRLLTLSAITSLTALSAAALLSACGGDSPPTASEVPITSFIAAYNASLKSATSLNTPAFLDLFDDAFLDDGYKKADLIANVKADVDAVAANPTALAFDSLYPQISLEDATLSGCDDKSGICTLTASYVNPAADATRANAAEIGRAHV